MSGVENLQIIVDYEGSKLYRNYAVIDGELPGGAGAIIEDMVDTIKNAQHVPF